MHQDTLDLDYLLVMFSLPVYLDERGRRYLDPLWLKDLVEHTRYLPRLTLACTRAPERTPPAHYLRVDSMPELADLRWVDLPLPRSTAQAVLQLPASLSRLWRALKQASIVHSSVVAWPLPEAWLLQPLLAWRARFHLIVVESAPWRLLPGSHTSALRRLRSRLWERMARYCLGRCDLALYTQEDYRRTLHGTATERGHVIPASWIDEATVCTPEQVDASWTGKSDSRSLRLVFAGRLTHAKGVELLIEGVRRLANGGQPVELDILGDGELKPVCEAAAAQMGAGCRIRLLGSLPYDAAFFQQLRGAHAVIVPSLSDEQPRIVYDAWSQGVPVIASRTPGLADSITPGHDGLLFEVGSADSLCDSLRWAAQHPAALHRMGLQALDSARALTHHEMHRRRLALIKSRLAQRSS